ncbi:hypothetical protein [Rhizorhabdus dicambivorans]|uniref:Lipoprotein n=1 Tax=Rhizorhabdus dicambivorans TaxID=1850238 RepID=A0A2A4FU84_9SPHN|nr:hypothetical protein [Rhizorhabdus dicambivorans]ATE64768.1 hypothetical protein CMV14_10440 [Rhizorhabdus dicambivorans]PCE41290.1 hypothetical protein COO09_15640 [Rhizorhabdus dicambivorans]
MASRSTILQRLALMSLPLALSACAPTVAPPPAPVPPPAPPAPPAPTLAKDWRDWPLAPGTWRYVPGTPVSEARYGEPQASQLVVRCDAAKRQVTIMRAGSAAELTILASTRSARFQAGHIDDRGIAMTGFILSANDGFLDVMAFSRGRIAVTAPGLAPVAVPAWAEPARAIEDCRK